MTNRTQIASYVAGPLGGLRDLIISEIKWPRDYVCLVIDPPKGFGSMPFIANSALLVEEASAPDIVLTFCEDSGELTKKLLHATKAASHAAAVWIAVATPPHPAPPQDLHARLGRICRELKWAEVERAELDLSWTISKIVRARR